MNGNMMHSPGKSSSTALAKNWLASFATSLSTADITAASELFADDCYWRDLLSFTWNIKTLEGKRQINDLLSATLSQIKPDNWRLEGEVTGDSINTESWFTFDTKVARGRGHLRLIRGKCHTLLTTVTELKGFEEKRAKSRAKGTTHVAQKHRETWLEQRAREEAELGHQTQPYCLIIGGGQGGIALAARLRKLDVPTIVVDKNTTAGDSWRNRYRSLALHDPVWYDHMPYLPFPDDWPVFTPKDKMGDWLEMYTKVMEINYWSSTECLDASFDSRAKNWNVTVRRDGVEIQLQPKQLVFATGAYGFPRMAQFSGVENFRGESLHTSTYSNGADYRGKKCVVIGSGSSAHDVCVDLWENDVDVTMIQRAPSIIVRSETLMELGFGSLYSEEALEQGITTDQADMIVASVPFRMLPLLHKPIYEEIARVDADFYKALTAAGFLWDFGEDGSGLMMKAMRTASGYYIDVGASQLIIDGKIKIKSGADIVKLQEKAIKMSDGSVIDADVIIHATGYLSLDSTIAKLISPEVAAKIGPFWGYGSGIRNDPGPWEGELRNMWKPTQQEALWFQGGNLHLSRHYSLYLALQIKARMENLPTPCYR